MSDRQDTDKRRKHMAHMDDKKAERMSDDYNSIRVRPDTRIDPMPRAEYDAQAAEIANLQADVRTYQDMVKDLTAQLAEARDKALDDAQLAAQQCLIDLAHSTGGDIERRASTLINAETHVSFAIRNLKGPTPRFTEWPEEDFDITVGKRKDTP